MVSARRYRLFLFAFVCCWAVPALAQSPAALVRQGNSLYESKEYVEAIDRYEEALVEKAEALEPKFNKANSYFRLDDLAEAIELFKEVAAESTDNQLIEKALKDGRLNPEADSLMAQRLCDIIPAVIFLTHQIAFRNPHILKE